MGCMLSNILGHSATKITINISGQLTKLLFKEGAPLFLAGDQKKIKGRLDHFETIMCVRRGHITSRFLGVGLDP